MSELEVVAVLFTDIVGFSLLATEAQREALAQLTAAAEACPSYMAAASKGHLLAAPAGDGFALAFRGDMLAAIRCAEELVAMKRIAPRIRLALHVGPVNVVSSDITGTQNIVGDGVNDAARALQGAGPQEILLTQRAFEIYSTSEAYGQRLVPVESIQVKHNRTLRLYKLAQRTEPSQGIPRWAAKWAARAHKKALTSGQARLASTDQIALRLLKIAKDVATGLILLALAMLVHVPLEKVEGYRQAQLYGYRVLQASARTPSTSSVTVVDIGDSLNIPDSNRTDLVKLKTVIGKLVELRPRALAIDIDFGVRDGRYLDEGDVLVPYLSQISKSGVNLSVAVSKEGLALGPQQWLGDEAYSSLVAHPLRPRDSLSGQVIMMARIRFSTTMAGAPRVIEVPSLAERLALDTSDDSGLFVDSDQSRPGRFPQVRQKYFEHESLWRGTKVESGGVRPQYYFLNFGSLEQIKRERTIRIGQDLENFDWGAVLRLVNSQRVLIGSISDKSDTWTHPLSGEREAGVYLHALAVSSLIESPLLTFTEWFRWVLAALSGLLVLGLTTLVRLRYLADPREVEVARIVLLSTGLVVAVIVGSGLALAKYGQTLWTDFYVVALIAVYHPKCERSAEKAVSAVRSSLACAWKKIVFGK